MSDAWRSKASACSYDKTLAAAPESISALHNKALHNKALALILLGEFDDAGACYTRIQHVAELELNTLAPLHELEGTLAGLRDPRLKIEVIPPGNSARITHPNYTGERRAVLFKGIHGNVGNVGGGRQAGGEGFQGGPGVLVFVEQ